MMKLSKTGYVLGVLFVSAIATISSYGSPPVDDIRKILDLATRSKLNYGITIISADDGSEIFRENSEQVFAPASNQKILTTISALSILKSDFNFTTTFGMKDNHLCVIGDGDPGFGDPVLCGDKSVTVVFDECAEKLRSLKISEISGNLILDDTVFDRQFHNPNWPAKQFNHWYAAPVGGLNFNDNCIDISVILDANKKGQMLISPISESIEITPVWQSVKSSRTIITPVWEGPEKLAVRIMLGSKPAGPVNMTVSDPNLFFATLLKDRLISAGIRVKGSIIFKRLRASNGSLPPEIRIVATHKTPIFDAVKRANKTSQNLFAECLFKRMGYGSASLKSNYAVGSWVTGSQAAKSFLKDTLNVPVENLVIDDGGGLSKTNRITTDILAKILLYAQKQPWGADYLKTLAVAGVDGTLKKRMKRTSAAGRVSAKTGYIAGISSLSGYVADSHGHPKIIFSMIFQFPSGKLWQAKSAEDKLCIRLAEYLGSVREQMPQNTIEPESYSKSSEEPDEE